MAQRLGADEPINPPSPFVWQFQSHQSADVSPQPVYRAASAAIHAATLQKIANNMGPTAAPWGTPYDCNLTSLVHLARLRGGCHLE